MSSRTTKGARIFAFAFLLISCRNLTEGQVASATLKSLNTNGKPLKLYFMSTNDRQIIGQASSQARTATAFTGSLTDKIAWKGEHVNFQLALAAREDHDNVSLEFTDLVSSGGAKISKSLIHYGAVRYVLSNESGGMCGSVSKSLPALQVADPIAPQQSFSIKKDEGQPVWITLDVPESATPGSYTSRIIVSESKLGRIDTLSLNLTVKDRTLPAEKSFHLDLWQYPLRAARYYQVKPWSEDHFNKMRPLMTALAKAGQKTITASFLWDNFNTQNWGPENLMVQITKNGNSFSYDFTNFDKWVSFMMSVGIDKEIMCFGMYPFNNNFNSYYHDAAQNKDLTVSYKFLSPEYKTFWTGMLKSFAQHVKEKGWQDKTVLFFDERPPQETMNLIAFIKSVDPSLKIGYCGGYNAQLEPNLADFSIVSYLKIPPEVVQKRQSQNRTTTFYNTCKEKHPNLFTYSSPAESVFMGWFAAANNYDGYLRYSFNIWDKDPLKESRSSELPAGDQFIAYPNGYSSIRFEKLIEGIQDYEKITVLKKTLRGKNLNSLNALLASAKQLEMDDYDKFIRDAQALINSL